MGGGSYLCRDSGGQGFLLDERNYRRSAFIRIADQWEKFLRRSEIPITKSGERYKDIDYYALLRIKDDYPYTGKYIKNNFGKLLNISEENIGQVEISTVTVEQGHLITDKDGMGLFFFIVYGDHYKKNGLPIICCFLSICCFS